MIKRFKILMPLGLFIIVVVLISGCGEDKATTKSIETAGQSPTASIPQPTATKILEPKIVLIEDTDTSFKISNKCEIQKNAGASGGSWIACPPAGQPPAPGAKINVTFSGTTVSVMYLTSPYGGIAKVQIDGKSYSEIDMYSKDVKLQVKTEIASNLPNTEHILNFEIANKRNPSTGRPNEAGVISIDAIEVKVPQ